MSPRPLRIGALDRDRHEAFFRYAPRIFPGIDFRPWAARGGWTDGYEIFALAEDDELVAGIGRSRMTFVWGGRECTGYQLGAVGTLPGRRGRGHSRILMDWLIGALDTPGQPVILFANDSVLDFYPRFGFRRVMQQHFGTDVALLPSGPPLRRLDLDDAPERARLAHLSTAATATGRGFGARDFHPIRLWHLSCRPLAAHWLDDPEALLVTSEAAGLLTVHDVLAGAPFNLQSALPRLIDGPVTSLAFGFEPQGWWPDAAAPGDDAEALLFVRGGPPLPARPFRFPDLAQT